MTRSLSVCVALFVGAPAAIARPDPCSSYPWTGDELVAPGASNSDFFPNRLVIVDDVAVVGAPGDDDLGDDRGAVHVFRRDGASWEHEQKIVYKDGEDDDAFGTSLAFDGDRIVVGAPAVNASRGAVYVFVLDAGEWVLEDDPLTASDAADGDQFGYSVGIDGSTLAAGAPQDDTGGTTGHGSIYIFDRSGSNWTQTTKLTGTSSATGRRLGDTLSMKGVTVASGAPGSFAAYVFALSGSWSETARLTDGTVQSFGWDVALADNAATLAVAAYQDTHSGITQAGSVQMYTLSGTWSFDEAVISPSPATAEHFGTRLDLDGNRLVVAEPAANFGVGSVHVFVDAGGTYDHRAELVPQVANTNFAFSGWGIGISGGAILVPERTPASAADDRVLIFNHDPCYPDCDNDCALTIADFGCFQTRFGLADPYADCNGDTFFNLADFGCFQTAYGLGCP